MTFSISRTGFVGLIHELETNTSGLQRNQRAGLNCGQCITKHGNKCAEGPHCQHFFLHKFRHTFATEHLRHGIDIRTLQTWMGHRDIKSTMVYLKGVQSKDALAKVNAGALAAYVAQPTAAAPATARHVAADGSSEPQAIQLPH